MNHKIDLPITLDWQQLATAPSYLIHFGAQVIFYAPKWIFDLFGRAVI
jgi:hypothetical protein